MTDHTVVPSYYRYTQERSESTETMPHGGKKKDRGPQRPGNMVEATERDRTTQERRQEAAERDRREAAGSRGRRGKVPTET